MGVATILRQQVAQLCTQYGEDCLFVPLVTYDNPASGTTSTAGTAESCKAILVRRDGKLANIEYDIALRQSAFGTRQVKGDDVVLVAASALSTTPAPGHTWYFGTTETSAGKRKVSDVEHTRVEGSNVCFLIGVSK